MTKFTFENDPQQYVMDFDFNVLCDAEAELGLDLLPAIMRWPMQSALELRGVVYALMKTKHTSVTVAEVGGLLTRELTAMRKVLALELIEAGIYEPREEIDESAPAVPADASLPQQQIETVSS
jgi:hypothetical protein